MKAPMTIISPWAKLMTSVALKIRTNPRATSPYTHPMEMPESSV